MTEEEARVWTGQRFGQDVAERLVAFVAMVEEENDRQNLVSPATIPQVWARHVVDSLQLIGLAQAGSWIDIGSGGGFPGMVIALADDRPVTLVEPRRKRAEFLRICADRLGLDRVVVQHKRIEQVEERAAIISARAVASIENLLLISAHCATPDTQWLLPRGTVDVMELQTLSRRHGMMFHVEQSITHPGSSIVVMNRR